MLEGDADLEPGVEDSSHVYRAAPLRFRRSVTWLRGLGKITTIPAISPIAQTKDVSSLMTFLYKTSRDILYTVLAEVAR
jgi:hypothetical protein